MSTGADNKSLPNTKEYEENYDRIFGKDHKPTRGTFIWDGQHFVPAVEYKPPPTALDAPVMVGRFYENQSVTELDANNRPVQIDIGPRPRHREYMKERGLTTVDDYNGKGGAWEKAEAERAKMRAGEPVRDPERRELIGKLAYEMEKKNGRRSR